MEETSQQSEFQTNILIDGDITNINNFERKLREFVTELNLKRQLLDEARREVQALQMKQLKLECTLDNERRESADIRSQLEVTFDTIKRWEEEIATARDKTSRQKLQLDSSILERDLFKDQNRILQIKVIELEKQVEELSGQLRSNSDSQNSVIQQQNQLKQIMQQLNTQMQHLEIEHKRLEVHNKSSIDFANQIQIDFNMNNQYRNRVLAENAKLQSKVLEITAENYKLKEENERNTILPKQNDEAMTKEMENIITELREKLAFEIENNNSLNALLGRAMKTKNNLIGIKEDSEKLAETEEANDGGDQ